MYELFGFVNRKDAMSIKPNTDLIQYNCSANIWLFCILQEEHVHVSNGIQI